MSKKLASKRDTQRKSVKRKVSKKSKKTGRKSSRNMKRISKKSRETLSYGFRNEFEETKNGKYVFVEQAIYEGPKGITIKLFNQENDKIEKILVSKNDDGTFMLKIRKGEKEDIKQLSLEDLKKEVKKHKVLEFAHDFISSLK